MLLVVVENLLHRLHTRVLIANVVLARLVLLVPVEDLNIPAISVISVLRDGCCEITHAADERRNQGDTGLRTGNSLREAEEKGEVAVDAVVTLELARSLDTLPSRSDLDEDALLLDADGLVKRDELLGLGLGRRLVVREARIDLGGDTAGNDLQDLLAKLNELCSRRDT